MGLKRSMEIVTNYNDWKHCGKRRKLGLGRDLKRKNEKNEKCGLTPSCPEPPPCAAGEGQTPPLLPPAVQAWLPGGGKGRRGDRNKQQAVA